MRFCCLFLTTSVTCASRRLALTDSEGSFAHSVVTSARALRAQ